MAGSMTSTGSAMSARFLALATALALAAFAAPAAMAAEGERVLNPELALISCSGISSKLAATTRSQARQGSASLLGAADSSAYSTVLDR